MLDHLSIFKVMHAFIHFNKNTQHIRTVNIYHFSKEKESTDIVIYLFNYTKVLFISADNKHLFLTSLCPFSLKENGGC